MAAPSAAASLLVSLGAGLPDLPTGQPVLAGLDREQLFEATAPLGQVGDFVLVASSDWLIGAARRSVGPGLERATAALYADLFVATRGQHLARIWNYVPAINAAGPDGLENYRAFCRARSVSFEAEFGAGHTRQMPAASAVGTDDDQLTVVFAAGPIAPRHHENPQQVPAYDYPREYGPRAPSFARATVVAGAKGTATVFISGTAAIRGHASVAAGDTVAQVACTIDNLRAISRACGLGENLAAGQAAQRHFKIYVRHAGEQRAIAAQLAGTLLQPDDLATYVRADICRAELTVEIEATLRGVRS